jgi:hypothetical protein
VPTKAEHNNRRKRGRPTVGDGYLGRSPRLSVAVAPKTLNDLAAAAKRSGISRASFTRQAIDEAIARAASELARSTRAAQGLSEKVIDPPTLGRVASLLRQESQ